MLLFVSNEKLKSEVIGWSNKFCIYRSPKLISWLKSFTLFKIRKPIIFMKTSLNFLQPQSGIGVVRCHTRTGSIRKDTVLQFARNSLTIAGTHSTVTEHSVGWGVYNGRRRNLLEIDSLGRSSNLRRNGLKEASCWFRKELTDGIFGRKSIVKSPPVLKTWTIGFPTFPMDLKVGCDIINKLIYSFFGSFVHILFVLNRCEAISNLNKFLNSSQQKTKVMS